ncbi:MAG: hypothetical protein ACO1N6_08800 [Microcella sp.]
MTGLRAAETPQTSPDITYPKPIARAITHIAEARAKHQKLRNDVHTAQQALDTAKAAEQTALAEAVAAGAGAPKVNTEIPQLERNVQYAEGLEHAAWQEVLAAIDELKAGFMSHSDELVALTIEHGAKVVAEYDEFVATALAGYQQQFGRLSEVGGLLRSISRYGVTGTKFDASVSMPQLRIPRATELGNVAQMVDRLRQLQEQKSAAALKASEPKPRGRSEETYRLPQSVDQAAG